MRLLRNLVLQDRASAGAEMALVAPFLLILLLGSVELGNYFLDAHALQKEVRNAARYGARLPLVTSYSCDPPSITPAAETMVQDMTRTGKIAPTSADPLLRPFFAEDGACEGDTSVVVAVRCVDESLYPGLWRGYDGDIPVVKVAGAVNYHSVLSTLGFDLRGVCLRAESEAPVIGL